MNECGKEENKRPKSNTELYQGISTQGAQFLLTENHLAHFC